MTNERFTSDDVIDRIYEASVIPDCWPEVIRNFASLAESREAALLAMNGETFKWISSSPLGEKIAADHYKYEGGLERSRRLIRLNRPGFFTDFDVFTEEEMASLPLFKDFLVPNGYGRGIASAIQIPTGETIILHAEGDLRLGRISRQALDRLDALRPHFARSAMISARLAFERARTAVDTLSGIGLAACAVAATGKVLVANTKFDEASGRWTTRGGDRIALLDARAGRQLSESLQLISTHLGVRSIALAATEEAQPAVLHVVPIRRLAQDMFSQACAILVLTTASNEVIQSTSLLQALFDLTPAEAAVAARVAAGQTLARIAHSDAKSQETVRNQLKSVLAKTGCRRQLDLARLLTGLVPPGTEA
jgi:DNA-binding CsgD family transcriptional regulator